MSEHTCAVEPGCVRCIEQAEETVSPRPAESGDDGGMNCTCVGGPHGGTTCKGCRA